jgi:hypothetical protein
MTQIVSFNSNSPSVPPLVAPSSAPPAKQAGPEQVESFHAGTDQPELTPGVMRRTMHGHEATSAGTLAQQTHSFLKTNLLTGVATGLRVAHGLLGMFFPPEAVARHMVASLKDQPVVGDDKVTRPEYQSLIPNASPEQVYTELVDHMKEAYASGGANLLLSDGGVKDHGRYMLEAPGHGLSPTVWLPLEVRLDPENKAIDFHCLDGHAFRGHNKFEFKPDGHGGTIVDQNSEFELSSAPINLVKGPMKVLEKQHDMWQTVHGFLSKHFEDSPKE